MKLNDLITNPSLRHDFLLLFDVQDGNPNGDPDAGNMPRVDPETMHGLVTDVCIKRKIRDYVDLTRGTDERFKIYVQNKGIALNDMHKRAYEALGLQTTGSKQKRDDVTKARQWMCNNFYDIRMFGAVMTTEVNCGQVRGPVQFTFARSVTPITPLDVSITRVAITRPEDAAVVVGENEEAGRGKVTEMGRKALLPYGLYLGKGFFSPKFAQDTGVTPEDLSVFWEALLNMWDLDRSASRGFMSLRGLYVFTHDNAVGRAPAHKLFDLVRVRPIPGVEVPRSFADYSVETPPEGPLSEFEGVTLTKLAG
ncbi:MAG: type I-C CRISPR-associated protein Cas7/Csd2 [Armatimonadota bacterium]|nr:type I-C CRISPR-associated protein Cas7/Csd2 [Armatimonadota bacterium]